MKPGTFAFVALLPLAAMAAPAGAIETSKATASSTELVQAQPLSASRVDKATQDRQVETSSPAIMAPAASGNRYNWMAGGGG